MATKLLLGNEDDAPYIDQTAVAAAPHLHTSFLCASIELRLPSPLSSSDKNHRGTCQ